MSRLGYQITKGDYDRLRPILFAGIRGFGVPVDDVEDLIQETLWQAQQALDKGQFRGESSLDTWVVGIAKRLCLKYRRSLQAAKRNALEVPLNDPERPDGELRIEADQPQTDRRVVDRQDLKRVKQAIDRLPDKFRGPLILNATGWSSKDIAKKLGMTVGQVTSRIQQARAILRRQRLRSP